MHKNLPVAVIGAGPVGLAAAAELVERKIPAVVFERGEHPGATVQDWAHVRLFTPWRYCMSDAARRLLEASGWTPPDDEALPTGQDIIERYLSPLADHPAVSDLIRYRAEVIALSRAGMDKLSSTNRDSAPFVVAWKTADGRQRETLARAIIDASGTWTRPNPMGIDGLSVPGESAIGDALSYGVPDVAGRERERYAGKSVLVVGAGHSAINVVLDLVELKRSQPSTRIAWALRRPSTDHLRGGGDKDELPARGELGERAENAVKEGMVTILAPFAAQSAERTDDGVAVEGIVSDEHIQLTFDRIVVATGFRPDHTISRELRVELDATVEAPPRLAPLIDPNLHSCGTVPPHGADVLSQPDKDFYIVGAKSYGRAPTFLMATGYEQVRSVVAAIAGDAHAAAEVRLNLPATGVCSSAAASAGSCCGPDGVGEAGELLAQHDTLGDCCQRA